jgi:DNA invertase Pin-like site-specific DNA recombinase
VQLVAIKEHIRLNGTPDLQTKVMITLFGLFAEIERDLIAERTKEGLAAARAKGRLPGRPKGVLGTSKLTGREAEIQSLLAKTVSKASIAKILGVSRSTLHSFIQSRRLA